MNSGSYFIVQVILLASHFTMAFLNLIAVKFAKNKLARMLGIWAYDDSHLGTAGIETIKLYLESYFDLAICAFINLDAFLQKPEEFGEFFKRSNDDLMCSILTIFYG